MPSVALCEGGLIILLMYYVYILRTRDGKRIYTGFTTDLEQRLNEHNSGKSRHTNKFRPWELVSYSMFESEEKARSFEKYLKTGSGIAFARRHLL